MSLMARLNYLFNRHPNRLPLFAATPKTGNRLSIVFAFSFLCRNHARHRPPMTGNHHGFSTLDSSKQLGKTSLGFGGLNPVHIILSGQYNQL